MALTPAIRAMLLPEEVEDFDREFRREMATATETLDLSGAVAMLARWQRVALSSQDPQAHRLMREHAAILATGGQIPMVRWRDIGNGLTPPICDHTLSEPMPGLRHLSYLERERRVSILRVMWIG
jgi:Family of unknown function (DUF6247)